MSTYLMVFHIWFHTRAISRNLKLGGYGQMFGGVNMREAQIDIQKHLKNRKKIHLVWGVSSSAGGEGSLYTPRWV